MFTRVNYLSGIRAAGRSGGGYLANVEDLIVCHWANVTGRQSGKGDGSAFGCDELDLQAGTAIVTMDDGSNVASF